ncbi:MAG: V-type ATP synthase subunit E family protein [Brevinemataceae bacterium]
MALQDIIQTLESEKLRQLEEKLDQAKTEATKWLIQQGESLDNIYESKFEHSKKQILKQQETLKSEKEFSHHFKELQSEDQFVKETIDILEKELLEFTKRDREEYKNIIYTWLQKIIKEESLSKFVVYAASQDVEFIQMYCQQNNIDAEVKENSSIRAGLLISITKYVNIDWTFDTLFKDRIKNLSRLLKECL